MTDQNRTLREILEHAEEQIDTYRHPDIDEASDWLDRLLQAGKLGGIGSDRISYLHVGREAVSIRTSYTVRSCAQSDDYEFPVSIIDAPDPIAAMTKWSNERQLAKLRSEVEQTKRSYEAALKRLSDKEAELALPSDAVSGGGA